MAGENAQNQRQATVEASTGTTLDYNGDWSALFDQASVIATDFNSRLLLWINLQLGSTWDNINSAMQAFAQNQGYNDWGSMGTFVIGGGPVLPTTGFGTEADITVLFVAEDGVTFFVQE